MPSIEVSRFVIKQ